MHSTPLVRHVLRDESVTRGLGDIEARMLVEWLADRAEQTAHALREIGAPLLLER